jgi:hypothetical protein
MKSFHSSVDSSQWQLSHSHGSKAGCLLLILVFIITCCAPGRKEPRQKPLIYEVASKTARSHVITETAIILSGYNFTIEFADSRRDYSAMRTHWRFSTESHRTETGELSLEVRDRVALHLSPRGIQSDRSTTLVASALEFEMQSRFEGKDKWLDIKPSSAFQEQYAEIVSDIRNRLRKRGYIFN